MTDTKRLEARRIWCGLDQDDLARGAGMSRATYWRKLKGVTEFTAGEIQRIGRILMLGSDELVEIFDLK